ncbi:hypothetical protein SL1157_0764 [Ruegeria lacuscaerulensis ITI-1157]|nr:hypothetical protein SL1157_0764 [Ruegeria lacuscaerulensis ITI-1157]SHJ37039.1 hypothetical protein SAMN05444404_1910 [Ruegeria lacuscaerulensis ITI-1157]
MTVSRKSLNTRVFDVLNEHLVLQDVPAEIQCALTNLFTSALEAARENRIGRSFENEKRQATIELEDVAKLLARILNKMQQLNPVARELLAREKLGLLDLSSGELEGYSWAGTVIGNPGAVEEWIEQIDVLRQSVERTRAELEPKLKQFGRGAPRKDGPLTVAQLCASAFKEFVGRPTYPTWNDYTDTYEGRLYRFVKDIFAAGEIKANPADFTKKAIDVVNRNYSMKK